MNIMNDCGWCVLIGEEEVVERDYLRIVELMGSMFDVEES